MSRESIEVNFQAAMASADELDGIANDLERALKHGYTGSMAQLSRDWTGENAVFYQQKGTKLTGQIEDSVSRIRKAASEVRRAARRIHQAELTALNIAKVRSFK